MPANTDAIDRLRAHWAGLTLSPAASDELYQVLDAGRDKFRKLPVTENPKENLLAGFMAGADFLRWTSWVSPGRRGDVLETALAWLPDIVAVTDEQYGEVRSWASRARNARKDSAKAFAPRVGSRA